MTKHSEINGRKHSLNLMCSKFLREYNYMLLLFPNILSLLYFQRIY